MNAALEQIARLVHAASGILLEENQYPALQSAVGRAGGTTDARTFLRSASDPIEGVNAVARLVDEVAVGETFFLRDRRQLETIDWFEALRRAHGGTIRIWSAACSTGEEPYSLALLASEAFFPEPPPVRIVATDISRPALVAAQEGRYRPRAVREVEPDLRNRYFEEDGGTYVVAGRLRGFVSFAQHNLVRDPLPPLGEAPFDLILCRNVLIYFNGETCNRVLMGLDRALRPGGRLVLGVADALCRTNPQLRRVARRPVPTPKPKLRTKPLPSPAETGRGTPETASADVRLIAALHAADAGRAQDGLDETAAATAADPLNANAFFVRGLLQLEAGAAEDAITSLRRALYIDPSFGLAAFELARAYEAAGNQAAARRSYEQALRTLDPEDDRQESILGQVDLADVVAACQARLEGLR